MSDTACQRCGRPARSGSTGNPNARIMRRAKTGVCVDCAAVLFLQRLDNMQGGNFGLPDALRHEHVQAQFANVMKAGNADADPAEINWDRVIEIWNIQPAPTDTLF